MFSNLIARIKNEIITGMIVDVNFVVIHLT